MTPNSIPWYSNGVFGALGYAAPYFEQRNQYTNNVGILKLHTAFGKLLLGVMNQPDVWKTTPPQTAYFPRSVGKAIDRIRATLVGNMVTTGETEVRNTSMGTDPKPFLIFPIPYFRVRNPWAKQWAYYALTGLSEAMRHPNNLDSLQINSDFASVVGVYTNLIYQELAIELLGKTQADVAKAGGIQAFQLTDADYAAYNPDAVFNQIERVDPGATPDFMLSPNDLGPIIEGIPAPLVTPFLKPWPMPYTAAPDASNQAAGAQGGTVQPAQTAAPADAPVAPTATIRQPSP